MAPGLAASLAAFTLAAALLTVTPGLDTMLVLRTGAAEGRRPAMFAALGIALGCLVWGLVVALGLGALLAVSRIAYRILTYAGACYLIVLGLRLLLARRSPPGTGSPSPGGVGPAALRRGLFTNLLNPKVGLFYVSFLPQFVPAGMRIGPTIFLLASIHAAMGLFWLGFLVVAAGRMTPVLRRPALIGAFDRATGGVFLLFGIRLAFVRR